MLLNHFADKSNPPAENGKTAEIQWILGISDRLGTSERRRGRELAMAVGIFRDPAMRAAGTTGLGASPQSLVDNGLEGARAAAAFGATTETAVNLLGATGKITRSTDGVADIVVSQDVAGTNNHKNQGPVCEVTPIRYSRASRDAKGKTVFSSNSKLIPM
jgi:hypothetical protein